MQIVSLDTIGMNVKANSLGKIRQKGHDGPVTLTWAT